MNLDVTGLQMKFYTRRFCSWIWEGGGQSWRFAWCTKYVSAIAGPTQKITVSFRAAGLLRPVCMTSMLRRGVKSVVTTRLEWIQKRPSVLRCFLVLLKSIRSDPGRSGTNCLKSESSRLQNLSWSCPLLGSQNLLFTSNTFSRISSWLFDYLTKLYQLPLLFNGERRRRWGSVERGKRYFSLNMKHAKPKFILVRELIKRCFYDVCLSRFVCLPLMWQTSSTTYTYFSNALQYWLGVVRRKTFCNLYWFRAVRYSGLHLLLRLRLPFVLFSVLCGRRQSASFIFRGR